MSESMIGPIGGEDINIIELATELLASVALAQRPRAVLLAEIERDIYAETVESFGFDPLACAS